MGLLDEAIREHLDLKRRRGADPAEIERSEREALGPVRRGPEPAAGAEDEAQPGLPYDAHTGAGWEEPDDEGEFEPDDEPEEGFDAPTRIVAAERRTDPKAPASEGRPAGPPTRPARPSSPVPEDLLMDDELFADPVPSERQPPNPAPGDETVEYRVEDALAAESEHGSKGEDPLEETPEFLQDTPDHDRLWFEQRPPRDFDFDK